MTRSDVSRVVAEFRKDYPALITFLQAAAIAQCPLATVYDWSSRNLLDDFKIRIGKRCLLDLEGFVTFLMTRESQLDSCAQVPDPSEIPIGPTPATRINSPFNQEANQ